MPIVFDKNWKDSAKQFPKFKGSKDPQVYYNLIDENDILSALGRACSKYARNLADYFFRALDPFSDLKGKIVKGAHQVEEPPVGGYVLHFTLEVGSNKYHDTFHCYLSQKDSGAFDICAVSWVGPTNVVNWYYPT